MRHWIEQGFEWIAKNILTILLYGGILTANLLFESTRKKLTFKEGLTVLLLAVIAGLLTKRICSIFIHNDDLVTVCALLACLAGDKFLRRLMEKAPSMFDDGWKTFIGYFKKEK